MIFKKVISFNYVQILDMIYSSNIPPLKGVIWTDFRGAKIVRRERLSTNYLCRYSFFNKVTRSDYSVITQTLINIC